MKKILILLAFFLFVPSAFAATNVYYSVGQNTTDNKTGSPTLTIDGSGNGTFSVAQTATNIGVGDKVTYGGSVAYISAKQSTSVWSLVTNLGATPSATSSAPVTSITHTFSSLANATSGFTGASYLNTSNLTTSGYIVNIPCYYDSGTDTSTASLSGITTNASDYIQIYTPTNTSTQVNQSQRHNGTYNTSVGYSVSETFTIAVNYTKVYGLQMDQPDAAASRCIAVTATNVTLAYNICKAFGSSVYAPWFINGGGSSAADYMYNNVVWNGNGGSSSGYYLGDQVYFYNNTVDGNFSVGINSPNGYVVAKKQYRVYQFGFRLWWHICHSLKQHLSRREQSRYGVSKQDARIR